MFQRLPIALSLVKAGTLSKNILNEIGKTVYYLHRAKEFA